MAYPLNGESALLFFGLFSVSVPLPFREYVPSWVVLQGAGVAKPFPSACLCFYQRHGDAPLTCSEPFSLYLAHPRTFLFFSFLIAYFSGRYFLERRVRLLSFKLGFFPVVGLFSPLFSSVRITAQPGDKAFSGAVLSCFLACPADSFSKEVFLSLLSKGQPCIRLKTVSDGFLFPVRFTGFCFVCTFLHLDGGFRRKGGVPFLRPYNFAVDARAAVPFFSSW